MIPNSKDTNFFSLSMLQQVINYIEKNLFEELTPAIIATHFYVSVSTLSSLFKIICRMTIMEYIRNRRLTLATEELSSSNIPIIDLAFKYGYETPEAFTKAFSRFHGFPPSFVRRGFPISKVFLPLQVTVTIQGGWDTIKLTKSNYAGQDQSFLFYYNTFIRDKGGNYTISEIINSVINNGFTLEKFDEHPAWTNDKIPGEFTVVATKRNSTCQTK